MDIFELIFRAMLLYAQKARLFFAAGLAYMLCALVVIGWASAVLLVDMAVALSAGGEYGEWARSFPHAAAIFTVTLCGIALISAGLSALWGGFLNLCTRIGAGLADVSLLDLVGYGIARAGVLAPIGHAHLVVLAMMALPALALVQIGDAVLSGFGVLLFFAALWVSALPFALAFPAAVEEGCGPVAAMILGLRALLSRLAASAVLMVFIALIYAAGVALLPLFPIYFFLVGAPISALALMAYYQKTRVRGFDRA